MWMFNNSKLLFFTISWICWYFMLRCICTLFSTNNSWHHRMWAVHDHNVPTAHFTGLLTFPRVAASVFHKLLLSWVDRAAEHEWLTKCLGVKSTNHSGSRGSWWEGGYKNDYNPLNHLDLTVCICVCVAACLLFAVVHSHSCKTGRNTGTHSSLCHFLAATVKRGLCSVRLNCRGWDE